MKKIYSVEKREIVYQSPKIFREINSLVTSLVKTVLPRNFCQKCVRENFHNFHTVSCTVWKLREFSLTLFWQKFRESNVYTKEITNELISWKNFQ